MAKVLVIDDNAAVRRVACRVLRSEGYETLEAEHGRAGVEAARRDRPDLVITDIFMPEQEGIETIQQLRALDADVPIIVISSLPSWGEDRPLENARVVGADVALEKPFAIDQLVGAVRELLERRG